MRIAITYSPWLLSARGSLDLNDYRDDPRGLSGSEMCAVRLLEELESAGHMVTLYTKFEPKSTPRLAPWEERCNDEHDVAVSINCPDDLRGMRAKLKVCYVLLNDFSFCKVGFEDHVDLFASPSQAHLDQCLTNPNWRQVEVTADSWREEVVSREGLEIGNQWPGALKAGPLTKRVFIGKQWDPSAKPWVVVPLGCDPERYVSAPLSKVPGRVVYCSSPDRGLHWLIQEWPKIRKAAPHATLRIFYRTRAWLRAFDNTGYYPPIEGQRQRALYIEEGLRRLEGHGVELFDSVSRATLEKELAMAEVLAYPCDPANEFTEGFSCSTLEGCAARACPVITDVDALGSIYGHAVPAVARHDLMGMTWQSAWSRNVIDCLQDAKRRDGINDRASALARSMTWNNTASKLMAAIQAHPSSK